MSDRWSAFDWGGARLGAMFSALVGLGWSQWGASGLSGAASVAVRIAGVVIGLALVIGCARPLGGRSRFERSPRGASPDERAQSRFALPTYLLIVVVEVFVIGGGNVVLGATGHSDFIVSWVAAVVGMHFLAFGRLFFAGFYWLGTALIAAGILGATVGVAGGGAGGIVAVSGLLTATSLFVASDWTVKGARASAHI